MIAAALGDQQALYGELAADQARNKQIAADVAEAARRGRQILVLTNRMEHLHRLERELHGHGVTLSCCTAS